MKKAVGTLLLAALFALPTLAAAAPWAVVASNFKSPAAGDFWDDREGIFTVDLGANPPAVYGPFLQGLLTKSSGGGVFDVAILPNGREALISNFGEAKVYRVNISDPKNPYLSGELKMEWDTGTVDPDTGDPVIYSFFAEDIAVAPDGTFAIVADGGFSPYLGFIDLRTFKISKIQKTVFPNPRFPDDRAKDRSYYANSVAISPDGKTVLFADYFQVQIHSGRVNAAKNGLTNFRSIFLCSKVDPADPKKCIGIDARPVNVTIAPNGQTALAAVATAGKLNSVGTWVPVDGVVAALKINPLTGMVTKGSPFFVTGLPKRDTLTPPRPASPGGNQSVAIAPGGQAFVLTQPIGEVDDPDSSDPLVKVNRFNILAKLQIVSPGKVVLKSAKYKALGTRGASQLYGVDSLAISRNGQWVLASNPSQSGATNVLTAVNAVSGATRSIRLPYEALPVGVDIAR